MGLEEPTPCLPGHQEGFPAHDCHPSGVPGAPVLPPPCPSSQLQAGPVVSPGRLEHTCCSLCNLHGAPGASTPWPWGTRVFGTRVVQGSLSPWIVPSPPDAPTR